VIVILGAGLSGLSAAFHLKAKEYQIFEKEAEAGGLCRSVVDDGFTFDHTGHLLHLSHPYTQKLLTELLPERLIKHQRRSAIYLKGRYIPPLSGEPLGITQRFNQGVFRRIHPSSLGECKERG